MRAKCKKKNTKGFSRAQLEHSWKKNKDCCKILGNSLYVKGLFLDTAVFSKRITCFSFHLQAVLL